MLRMCTGEDVSGWRVPLPWVHLSLVNINIFHIKYSAENRAYWYIRLKIGLIYGVLKDCSTFGDVQPQEKSIIAKQELFGKFVIRVISGLMVWPYSIEYLAFLF